MTNKQFTIKGLPNDLLTNEVVNVRRLKTESNSRQEAAMGEGNYFTASLFRENRLIDGVPTYVIVDTGDSYHILEELSVSIDYSNITDGSVIVNTRFYAQDSNKSDFTVTGGTPINMGVPLNLDFVNKLSQAAFRFDDATVTINSGVEDFVIYASQYYREASGNRESISGLQSSFFEKGRKLIMSPNKQYIFQTISSGTGDGTVDSLAQFSFTEVEAPE